MVPQAWLIGVDGTDGIVKVYDTLDVKILDLVILAKLAQPSYKLVVEKLLNAYLFPHLSLFNMLSAPLICSPNWLLHSVAYKLITIIIIASLAVG